MRRWFASALALAGLVLLGASGSGARSRGEIRVPFTHAGHVPATWFRGELRGGPEAERDCRGCHAFLPDGSVRDPQAVCARCHYTGTFELAARAGFERDLSLLRDETAIAGFDHPSHASLACRTCHESRQELPIPRGIGSCTTCHGPDAEPDLELLPGRQLAAGWRAAFHERLNDVARSPRIDPQAMGSFRHADHMPLRDSPKGLEDYEVPSSEAGQNHCGTCHAGLKRAARTELLDQLVSLESCERCHLAEKRPLRFSLDLPAARVASRAADAFAHADHLGLGPPDETVCSTGAYADVRGQGCNACHVRSDDGEYELAGAQTYEGCRTCHTPQRWAAEGPGWSHGEWSSCSGCHAFDTADMAADRRRTDVARPRPELFRMEAQTHPLISGSPVSEECKACHVATVDELPSRIGERPFRHATHLGAYDPAAATILTQECLTCHPGLSAAQGSQAIGSESREATGRALTYDPAACGRCHLGSRIAPVFDETAPEGARRQVLDFSHADHVGKPSPRGGSLGCVECHVGPEAPAAYEAGDMGILPAAADCSLCHGHDERRAPLTGDAGAEAVASCALCHGERIPPVGAPEREQELPALVAAVDGPQHHPLDRACAECHVLTPASSAWPKRTFVGRAGTTDKDIHAEGRPDDCMACHWHDPEGEPDEGYRELLGGLLEGYPGISAAGR